LLKILDIVDNVRMDCSDPVRIFIVFYSLEMQFWQNLSDFLKSCIMTNLRVLMEKGSIKHPLHDCRHNCLCQILSSVLDYLT